MPIAVTSTHHKSMIAVTDYCHKYASQKILHLKCTIITCILQSFPTAIFVSNRADPNEVTIAIIMGRSFIIGLYTRH